MRGGDPMKRVFRFTALVLVLAHLMLVPAFAEGGVSSDVLDKMKAAAAGTAVSSGAAVTPSAEKASSPSAASASEGEPSADEYTPVTTFGTAGDVMLGGLEIRAGRWYTVIDGELCEAPPWPDSYLYYSASQSRLTLHEFHYTVTSDKLGKGDTFAGLYLPKDMKIVLEGENELINRGYTTVDGKKISNGVYAGENKITFDGNGVLKVNTRSDMSGFGVKASWIRLEGDFIGLSIFGMSGAFSVDPSFNDEREVIVRRADLHPDYNGDVTVRDGNPYNPLTYTRYRYILLAVGDQMSPQQLLQAKINAAYAQALSDRDDAEAQALYEYNQAMEQGIAEMNEGLNQWQAETYSEIQSGYNQWQDELNNEWSLTGAWEPYTGSSEPSPGDALAGLLLGGLG